jgi:ATP-dependent Lon protease
MLNEKKRRVVLSPDDPAARYELAEALFAEGEHEAAEKQLARALAIDPGHAAARRLMARTLRAQGRPVPAERTLDEAVRRDPDDAGAREELADLLLEAERYDEAILHLEEALRVRPDHASQRLRVIELTMMRRLFARAERHLAEARKRAPGDAAVESRAALLAKLTGRAAGVLRSAITDGQEALLARSRRALDAGPLAEAARTAGLRPAVIALREGDAAAAKRALVTAPAEAQKGAAFELLRAETALIDGDRAKAEAAFRRATERAPEAALGWARLGEIVLAAGQAEEAAAALAEAALRAPRDPEVLEALGDALFAVGRRDEALARYEAAAALRPEVLLDAKIAEVRVPPSAIEGDVAQVGRALVLGWNPTGGAVSPLQAEAVPGRGELHVTGNVRGSGQEAARVVHSYLVSRAKALGIERAVAERDLHLHYADVDLAKEGMSAGLPLALAALSAYRGRPLPAALAATGQLSLDGAVLPVAGLANKLLAAYLADVRTVIAPRRNLFAIRSLPAEVEGRLRVVFVDSLREAIDAVWERA